MSVGALGDAFSHSRARALHGAKPFLGAALLMYGLALYIVAFTPSLQEGSDGWALVRVAKIATIAGNACLVVGGIIGFSGRPKWFFAPHVRDLPAPWRGDLAEKEARAAGRAAPRVHPKPATRRRTGSEACELHISRLQDSYFGRWGRYVIEVNNKRVGAIRRSESVSVMVEPGVEILVKARSFHVISNEWRGTLMPGERVDLKLGSGASEEVFDMLGPDVLLALFEV